MLPGTSRECWGDSQRRQRGAGPGWLPQTPRQGNCTVSKRHQDRVDGEETDKHCWSIIQRYRGIVAPVGSIETQEGIGICFFRRVPKAGYRGVWVRAPLHGSSRDTDKHATSWKGQDTTPETADCFDGGNGGHKSSCDLRPYRSSLVAVTVSLYISVYALVESSFHISEEGRLTSYR